MKTFPWLIIVVVLISTVSDDENKGAITDRLNYLSLLKFDVIFPLTFSSFVKFENIQRKNRIYIKKKTFYFFIETQQKRFRNGLDEFIQSKWYFVTIQKSI